MSEKNLSLKRVAREVLEAYRLRKWIPRDLLVDLETAIKEPKATEKEKAKDAPFEWDKISKLTARGRNGNFAVQGIEIDRTALVDGEGVGTVALFSKQRGKTAPVLLTGESHELVPMFRAIADILEGDHSQTIALKFKI